MRRACPGRGQDSARECSSGQEKGRQHVSLDWRRRFGIRLGLTGHEKIQIKHPRGHSAIRQSHRHDAQRHDQDVQRHQECYILMEPFESREGRRFDERRHNPRRHSTPPVLHMKHPRSLAGVEYGGTEAKQPRQTEYHVRARGKVDLCKNPWQTGLDGECIYCIQNLITYHQECSAQQRETPCSCSQKTMDLPTATTPTSSRASSQSSNTLA